MVAIAQLGVRFGRGLTPWCPCRSTWNGRTALRWGARRPRELAAMRSGCSAETAGIWSLPDADRAGRPGNRRCTDRSSDLNRHGRASGVREPCRGPGSHDRAHSGRGSARSRARCPRYLRPTPAHGGEDHPVRCAPKGSDRCWPRRGPRVPRGTLSGAMGRREAGNLPGTGSGPGTTSPNPTPYR